jgi:DNA-binding XRE family transcriptional regulator
MSYWRWAEELSIRDAARVIGVSKNALFRFENGHPINQKALADILRWLLSSK